MIALQVVVGGAAFGTELSVSKIVWVHVSLATVTWLTILWTVAAFGRPAANEAVMRGKVALHSSAADAAARPPAFREGNPAPIGTRFARQLGVCKPISLHRRAYC
jgi:hypothetical protein